MPPFGSDKPWALPMRYTSDVDPSHQSAQGSQQGPQEPSQRDERDIDELINRPPSEPGQRNAGGLSRPDPAKADNSPMEYPQAGQRMNDVLDVHDHDELEGPEQYVLPKETHVPIKPFVNHETAGTAYDPDARGHELVGRQPSIPGPSQESRTSLNL